MEDALSLMKELLNRLLGYDEQRTGCVEAPLFCHVLRQGLRRVGAWSAPRLPADEDEPTRASAAAGAARALPRPFDNSVCYLDFWAMLHTEVMLHREIPQFAGLYERASAQMIGIDGPQLDALRQYAQNARVPAPKPAARPTARPAAAAPARGAGGGGSPTARRGAKGGDADGADRPETTSGLPRAATSASSSGRRTGPGTMTVAPAADDDRTPVERRGESRSSTRSRATSRRRRGA